MNKPYIYEGSIRAAIAEQSGDSKNLLRQFSAELFHSIEQALLKDGHIRLNHFGSFSLKWSKQRRGRNPQTGEAIIIAAHPRVVFTPAKALKEQLNIQPTQPVTASKQKHSTQPPTSNNFQLNREPYLIKNINSPDKPADKTSAQLIKPLAAALVIALGVVYFLPKQATLEDIDSKVAMPANNIQAISVSDNRMNPANTSDQKASIEEQPAIARSVTETQAEPDKAKHIFFTERSHQLINGDSLWRLSNKHYINPFYWPHIYQANRYKIRNPNRLFTGRTITLPTLYGSPDSLTKKDKKHIAEGYFLIYLYQKKHNKPFPYYALLGASKYDPSIIEDRIYEIDEKDWQSLQLASN